jgi:hypothetical protein
MFSAWMSNFWRHNAAALAILDTAEINLYSEVSAMENKSNQRGKVYVKVFWWPLIISLALSILLTIFLNAIFR